MFVMWEGSEMLKQNQAIFSEGQNQIENEREVGRLRKVKKEWGIGKIKKKVKEEFIKGVTAYVQNTQLEVVGINEILKKIEEE